MAQRGSGSKLRAGPVGGLAGAGLFWALTVSATADPLGFEICEKLRAEQGRLRALGVAQNLERGASWGLRNLAPSEIASVRRYIYLVEQVTFRCPPPLPVKANTKGSGAGKATPAKRRPVPPLPVRKAGLARGVQGFLTFAPNFQVSGTSTDVSRPKPSRPVQARPARPPQRVEKNKSPGPGSNPIDLFKAWTGSE